MQTVGVDYANLNIRHGTLNSYNFKRTISATVGQVKATMLHLLLFSCVSLWSVSSQMLPDVCHVTAMLDFDLTSFYKQPQSHHRVSGSFAVHVLEEHACEPRK